MSAVQTPTLLDDTAVREAFAAARASGKRAKEAAESLGIGEGRAVAAHCGEHSYPPKAVPLAGPWIDLLKALEPCGPLMGLTRNETTVHEKTGVYRKLSAMGPNGNMGLALGEDIDLRLFFGQWHAGFAVTELAANPQNRPNVSLQFFDASGKAVHKIFQREATDRDAFDAVVKRFTAPVCNAVFGPAAAVPAVLPDAQINVAGMGDAWGAMQDTHEFFGLLKKFNVERQQSLRLMQGRFTQPLAHSALRDLLHSASFDAVPIMVFVGSAGCIQIHTGPVVRIEPMDIRGVQWLNVIDPSFNLHLREDSIAHIWLVEKPTADGVVTSVEAFDQDGALMAMFFGARKPGQPELQTWRDLVAQLPRLEVVAA
ncbi:hemin-degrading factor [Rhodoferax sp.]|uniref:hemin-degrading factor n=1 Tax=Rhodoferax sp. TaxID=50421 RepID=UPI00374D82F7